MIYTDSVKQVQFLSGGQNSPVLLEPTLYSKKVICLITLKDNDGLVEIAFWT
jgi:hypothetical protein